MVFSYFLLLVIPEMLGIIRILVDFFDLFLVFSLVRKRIERRLRQFSIVVLTSSFCVCKPLVYLASHALRLCFSLLLSFLFSVVVGEEEEVCLGCLEVRLW